MSARKVRGHFAAMLIPAADGFVLTTLVNIRKNKSRAKEVAKKATLLRELERLTGAPVSGYAKSLDGVSRRWTGVKANKPDH